MLAPKAIFYTNTEFLFGYLLKQYYFSGSDFFLIYTYYNIIYTE